MSASRLAGKLAVVTGAASGIGRSTCKLLTARGAKVVAVDQNSESLDKIDPTSISSKYSLDVSRKSDINDLYATLEKEYSTPPQVLVNSAGITRDTFLLKMTEDQWDQVMNVNLKGTFLMTQTHAAHLIQSKLTGGSIVNISSVSAKGNIGQANYSASKAGVIGFTKTAAMELARFGVRVNCILPGFIDTPMTEVVPENLLQGVIKMIPMKRTGSPEEVAELISFLSSDESSYMTGTAIHVDGGIRM